jgi:hypothetical protein
VIALLALLLSDWADLSLIEETRVRQMMMRHLLLILFAFKAEDIEGLVILVGEGDDSLSSDSTR